MKHINSNQTLCVRSGTIENPLPRGITTPIYTSTSYPYLDAPELLYPRHFNTPNQRVTADKIRVLEGGEAGMVFSSGMAAITTTLLSILKQGDHAVFQPNLYGGTLSFIERYLPRYGIGYSFSKSQSIEDLKAALKPETRLIYIETPSNPLLSITDIIGTADLAKSNRLISVIDNTFASPINQTPLKHGIDIVINSATKYMGGHSDICAGAVVTSRAIMERIAGLARELGGSLDAHTCYMLERSLNTLAVRVKQQNANAMALAEFLSGHEKVTAVYYPGLPGHEGADIAKRQMAGFGGMLSFELAQDDTSQFQKRLKLIHPSMSLGGVETILCAPYLTTHAGQTPEQREKLGISDRLLRLSVGIEDLDDLKYDLSQALDGGPRP